MSPGPVGTIVSDLCVLEPSWKSERRLDGGLLVACRVAHRARKNVPLAVPVSPILYVESFSLSKSTESETKLALRAPSPHYRPYSPVYDMHKKRKEQKKMVQPPI